MSGRFWSIDLHMTPFRSTKIICTIGPASMGEDILEALIVEGMDVARLNLSHGSPEEHRQVARSVRAIAARHDRTVAILADIPGSKFRVGAISPEKIVLKPGGFVVLTSGACTQGEIPIDSEEIIGLITLGGKILIGDGRMEIVVEELRGEKIYCRVISGGVVTCGRGVVVPGMHPRRPYLDATRRENLRVAATLAPDLIALSLVAGPSDIREVREFLKQEGLSSPLIAKIELAEAIGAFSDILSSSDGVMVARGDMGVHIPLERVPLVQKEIIRASNIAGKPVITATEMLESMVTENRPTRAEAADVANAIIDGTDAVMLSDETAVGEHVEATLKTMVRIAEETDAAIPYSHKIRERADWTDHTVGEALSYHACCLADDLSARAIVAFTKAGITAGRVSKFRPGVPILAITADEAIGKRLALRWGVIPIHHEFPRSFEGFLSIAGDLAHTLGLATPGEVVIVIAGFPLGEGGATNLLKVHRV